MSLFGSLVGAGLGLLGSSMQSRAAQRAAQTSANAQVEAARIAAEEARFRPVGVTTRFGASNFQFDPQGRLTGAGYTVSPELAAIQDRLLSQAGGVSTGLSDQALGATQGLFNLGQQYLATSPEQAAADFMARQQAVLAPGRERTLAGIRTNLFNTGREGLSIAQGGNMMAANPEMAAYYNSLAQQDLDLAARAQQEGRSATQFGAGLFGMGAQAAQAGLSPLQSQLGVASTIEDLGRGGMDIGSALGGRAMQGGNAAAQALLSGGLGAARTLQGPASYSNAGAFLSGLAGNQQLMSGIGNWMSGTGAAGNPNYTVDPMGMGVGWGNFDTASLPGGWRN